MGEYKKTTKNDIDLPNYCLFFIEKIQKQLAKVDFDKHRNAEIFINTSSHPYCYDALELIVRTFTRKGYRLNIPTYKLILKGGKKSCEYKWVIEKKNDCNDCDDLPF